MLKPQKQLMKGLLSMRNKIGVYATKISDTRTGTWRMERPVVSEKCVACGICTKYCPGYFIEIEDRAVIDYDYCKGCGICESLCPVKAISMIEEVE